MQADLFGLYSSRPYLALFTVQRLPGDCPALRFLPAPVCWLHFNLSNVEFNATLVLLQAHASSGKDRTIYATVNTGAMLQYRARMLAGESAF